MSNNFSLALGLLFELHETNISELHGHEQDVRATVAFGDKIVTSSRDRTVRTWSLNGEPLQTLYVLQN